MAALYFDNIIATLKKTSLLTVTLPLSIYWDKQANSLTPYTGVCEFFLSVKFTTLLALLAGG